MAEIWKPLTIETYQTWIQAILEEASDELNDWETRFIEDINVKLGFNVNLSESQAKKLESIYASKTK